MCARGCRGCANPGFASAEMWRNMTARRSRPPTRLGWPGEPAARTGWAARPPTPPARPLKTPPPQPRRPLRGKPGRNPTQLHYARQGIVTPEMEFIAIRENLGLEEALGASTGKEPRHAPGFQHPGLSGQPGTPSVFGAFPPRTPRVITPEFVRQEMAAGRALIPANVNHYRSASR